MDNKYYLLALNRINKIGPRFVLKCLKRWPNLSEMFRLPSQDLIKIGFSESLACSISNFDFRQVDDDLRWEQSPNNSLLTWCDEEYPWLLKEIHDPPVVLYAKGDLSCFNTQKIAMVGTRKPSVIGSETAWNFAFELASKGITIVSGLALGIDAKAHGGCLEANGRTIAVMGTGIDCIYPYRHRALAAQICEKGLILSEFPLKSPPIAGHFPRRNRIISGLSSATLVVEAAVRSGSLITARFALEQNRDVWAIPGSIHNTQARGCHHLVQQGAKLITSCKDILDELGLDQNNIERVVSKDSIACENKQLVMSIGFEVTDIDKIIRRSGLSIKEAMCGLAELELQGIINAVSGGYMRCKL